MGIGGAFFVAGGLVNAFAQDMAMLIVGRVLLGFGVGESFGSALQKIVQPAGGR